jgi:hypothetical protein
VGCARDRAVGVTGTSGVYPRANTTFHFRCLGSACPQSGRTCPPLSIHPVPLTAVSQPLYVQTSPERNPKRAILCGYIFFHFRSRDGSPPSEPVIDQDGLPPSARAYFLFGHRSTVASTRPSCGLIIRSIPLRAGSHLNRTACSSSYRVSRSLVSPLLRS